MEKHDKIAEIIKSNRTVENRVVKVDSKNVLKDFFNLEDNKNLPVKTEQELKLVQQAMVDLHVGHQLAHGELTSELWGDKEYEDKDVIASTLRIGSDRSTSVANRTAKVCTSPAGTSSADREFKEVKNYLTPGYKSSTKMTAGKKELKKVKARVES